MSNNRSAFEAIPGKDALVEYQPKFYPAKTYVEKDGLVYKSLTATSNTFLTPQWELIADLREVRVPNISSRNALTGNTPTSGTTGIRIPILDNTNVLVLNAIGDPLVGVNNFARYNYNKTLGTWLLLQIGTGATNSNVSNYQLLTNKPAVVSGVTVIAGAGLNGGGSVIGTAIAPFAAGGTINVSHADTSSLADINNSGYAYVQKLNFDTFGHVTGQTSSTWSHPATSGQASVTNSGFAYIQSVSLDANGHVTGLGTSTWAHPDTSTQADSVNTSNTFIQSIYLDGAGHVTSIATGTAAGGGGGGSPLKYNGDSGGVLTMNTGATLTISGGTNILTQRTGSAANPGLRINFNPAGASTQLQLNNAGVLGASANLTFASNILTSPNYNVSAVPVSGTTGDQILTRNAGTGAVQRIGVNNILNILTANNGINRIGNNFSLGGNLTGNTTIGGGFDFTFANNSWTFGSRTGTVGAGSFVHGSGNIASNTHSYAEGFNTTASGFASHAEGQLTIASGAGSHAEGVIATASGSVSHAQGQNTVASGNRSHAGGFGLAFNIISSAESSFNHSTNNGSQTTGHGALADRSAILGGLNHNIEVGNTGAAIIGGTAIKLTGTSYVDHTAVANLAIMTNPVVGIASDDVLVRSSTTGRIRRVTQASLSSGGATPAGSNTQIQFNNAGVFGANSSFTFSGGTTLNVQRLKLIAPPTATPSANAVILLRDIFSNETLSYGSYASQSFLLPLNNLTFTPATPSTNFKLSLTSVSGPGLNANNLIIGASDKTGGNGSGGNLYLNAGYSSASAGSGGTVIMLGGDMIAGGGGSAGNIHIKSGNNLGSGLNQKGGNVHINTGTGTGVGSFAGKGNIGLFSDPTVSPITFFGFGSNVINVAPATIIPIAAPPSGILIWYDSTTNNLRAWKAGSGSPVTII
jgi:hypothetical protein